MRTIRKIIKTLFLICSAIGIVSCSLSFVPCYDKGRFEAERL